MASLFAACANHLSIGSSLWVPSANRSVPMGLNVAALYTYGCPGLSVKQLVNARADDGVFPGARFYWEDTLTVDVIAIATTRFIKRNFYKHPKVLAVNLRNPISFGQMWNNRVRVEYAACSEDAKLLPKLGPWFRLMFVIGHHHNFYMRRLLGCYASGQVKVMKETCTQSES